MAIDNPYREVFARGDSERECAEEWARIRSQGVGGSEVAAIMGLSAYSSPLQVWLEKTGRAASEDISGKPAVEWGNRLEGMLVQKFRECHPELRVMHNKSRSARRMYVSKERPWAFANLDGTATAKDGSRYVLEAKTAGATRARDWEGGVPAYYLTQVTHYLSVTGWKGAWVVVLIGGQDYREYFVERDEEDVEAVERAVDEFWHGSVEADSMPVMVGADGEGRALAGMFPDSDGEVEQTLEADFPELSELAAVKEAEKELAKRKRQLEATVKARIGDGKGVSTERWKATWSRYEKTTTKLDEDKLERLFPGAMATCATKTVKMHDGGLRLAAVKE